MLPFTGLFKNINCPLFESNECSRAYCHYKHVKKGKHSVTFRLVIAEISLF